MKHTGNIQLAARYVSALFDVALKASAIDAVEADLNGLATSAETNPAFGEFLTNPLLGSAQKSKAVSALMDKFAVNAVTKQFLIILAEQKRLPLLPLIAELFSKKAEEARGEMSVELVSAAPINQDEQAAITQRLEKAYGKKITLQTSVDASLIGGMIIKIGSKQLDASLAGKLSRIEHTLKAA